MPEEGTIPYRRRIISSRRFRVGVNRLSTISDVAAWIRGISRYQRGHSRSAGTRTYLDHCAFPAWTNGGVTRQTSQTQLEFEKASSKLGLPFVYELKLEHPFASPNASPDCGSSDAGSLNLVRAAWLFL